MNMNSIFEVLLRMGNGKLRRLIKGILLIIGFQDIVDFHFLSETFCGHLQDVLGLEASRMLELASPDPQRLLALPLKVIVVRHQVDVRHRDVVLLGDLAGGKPGEAADGQLWLGREGWVKKRGTESMGGRIRWCAA